MTPSTRDTVLFWIKVSLGLTGMLLMFGMLTCLIFFTIAQIRTLDENRARDRAMLQRTLPNCGSTTRRCWTTGPSCNDWHAPGAVKGAPYARRF